MRRSAGGAQHGRFAMSAGGGESPGRALRTTSAHHAGDCADPSPLWPPDRAPTRRALRNDDSAAAPPPQARSGRAAPLTTSRAAAPRGSAGWAPPGRRVRRTGVYARLRLIPRDTALHSRAPRRARRRLRPLRSGPPERAQPWAPRSRARVRASARPPWGHVLYDIGARSNERRTPAGSRPAPPRLLQTPSCPYLRRPGSTPPPLDLRPTSGRD